MARWVFLNSRTPSGAREKFWYWIHTRPNDTEDRGGPFFTLAECIDDAAQHGFDEQRLDIAE
ncbi:MAG: hypothetical protein ACM3SS_11170 [Rhodospirillaceae bacterium]